MDGDVPVVHPTDVDRRTGWPKVIAGTIGTADTLQKNPAARDMLRDRFGVRAIEMEASGLQNAAWAQGADIYVVRGICDYCDAHKSNVWQNYAAGAAAAFTRSLIEAMPSDWFSSSD
jgi:nucleoside phosphorylase